MNPKYPIFIISKGRWQSNLTANALEEMGVPYALVVEPNEVELYAKNIASRHLIVTPSNLSELGMGSIPVRSLVWEMAKYLKVERYWLMDDNIRGFERLNRNKRSKVLTGSIFRASEDFVDRYVNVALAGFEYRNFAGGARRKKPPFRLNTRVYSCTLIKTDMPYRWRGRYNEDTDLSLRVLKDGWATVLFQCFLQNKVASMTMKGGNTDTIYNTGDNRKEFAESLVQQHPDIVKVVWRYNRWHHEVNYKPFLNNALIRNNNVSIGSNQVNEYGMKLVNATEVK